VSIIFFSHSTHFLQSLNMICFQSFKHYHCQALNWALQLRIFDYNWLNFIADFSEICKKIFKLFTIISSFVKTDLILYNSEKVQTLFYEKIKKLRSLISSFFSLFLIMSIWFISQTVFKLYQYAADLHDIWNYLKMSTFFHW